MESNSNHKTNSPAELIYTLTRRVKQLPAAFWISLLMSTILGIVFIGRIIVRSFEQDSILDEGAYLYKGYIFASGQYEIYEDYGPWGNHMPLSFLIPGYVQLWFGPGLRTGRYLAIALAVLTLIGTWVVSNKLAGKWAGVLAVIYLAFNPVLIDIYSTMNSQGLIACMLVWTFVFATGETRSNLQLILAAALAGLMLLTRINMAPVLPILLLYIYFQHGFRPAFWAFLVGGVTVVLGHLLFWPGILKMWAAWLPGSITPFLDPWRIQDPGLPYWDPVYTDRDRFNSFTYTLLNYFFPLAGWILISPFLLIRNSWNTKYARNLAFFLFVLFTLLLLLHSWASLLNNYCLYCFTPYLSFFVLIGVFMIVYIFKQISQPPPLSYTGYIFVLVPIITAAIGFAVSDAIEPLTSSISNILIPRKLFDLSSTGAIPLWGVLDNKFGIDQKQSAWLIAGGLGFVAGILILCTELFVLKSPITQKIIRRIISREKTPLYMIKGYLFIGLIISSLFLNFRNDVSSACKTDMITAYEIIGNQLKEAIPEGKTIYWHGTPSVIPLLYLPNRSIYPPQINNGYSLRIGGDTDELSRFGRWNEEHRELWLQEADYFIVQNIRYDSEWNKYEVDLISRLSSTNFDELPPTAPVNICGNKTELHIYRRLDP